MQFTTINKERLLEQTKSLYDQIQVFHAQLTEPSIQPKEAPASEQYISLLKEVAVQEKHMKRLKDNIFFLKSSNPKQNNFQLNSEESELQMLKAERDQLATERSLLTDRFADKRKHLEDNTSLGDHKTALTNDWNSNRKHNRELKASMVEIERQIRKYHLLQRTEEKPHSNQIGQEDTQQLAVEVQKMNVRTSQYSEEWKPKLAALDAQFARLRQAQRNIKRALEEALKEDQSWQARANALRTEERFAKDRERVSTVPQKTAQSRPSGRVKPIGRLWTPTKLQATLEAAKALNQPLKIPVVSSQTQLNSDRKRLMGDQINSQLRQRVLSSVSTPSVPVDLQHLIDRSLGKVKAKASKMNVQKKDELTNRVKELQVILSTPKPKALEKQTNNNSIELKTQVTQSKLKETVKQADKKQTKLRNVSPQKNLINDKTKVKVQENKQLQQKNNNQLAQNKNKEMQSNKNKQMLQNRNKELLQNKQSSPNKSNIGTEIKTVKQVNNVKQPVKQVDKNIKNEVDKVGNSNTSKSTSQISPIKDNKQKVVGKADSSSKGINDVNVQSNQGTNQPILSPSRMKPIQKQPQKSSVVGSISINLLDTKINSVAPTNEDDPELVPKMILRRPTVGKQSSGVGTHN